MKQSNLDSKVNEAMALLDEPVNLSSVNLYDDIFPQLDKINVKPSPVNYIIMILILVMGLSSGVYLGISIEKKRSEAENINFQNTGQEKNVIPLEKIIMGKDFN